MAEKERVIKEKLSHSGIWDFAALYKYVHSWLQDEGGYDVQEEKYSEKVSGNKRDISIEWAASKKVSDYFKFEVKISFDISGLEEIEVEVDKKKKKTNRGNVSVDIGGTLIRDPDSKWDVSPFWRMMRDTYNKYIIPGRVDNMLGKVQGDMQRLKEEIKAFLELSGKR